MRLLVLLPLLCLSIPLSFFFHGSLRSPAPLDGLQLLRGLVRLLVLLPLLCLSIPLSFFFHGSLRSPAPLDGLQLLRGLVRSLVLLVSEHSTVFFFHGSCPSLQLLLPPRPAPTLVSAFHCLFLPRLSSQSCPSGWLAASARPCAPPRPAPICQILFVLLLGRFCSMFLRILFSCSMFLRVLSHLFHLLRLLRPLHKILCHLLPPGSCPMTSASPELFTSCSLQRPDSSLPSSRCLCAGKGLSSLCRTLLIASDGE